jgi:hypothetical protein
MDKNRSSLGESSRETTNLADSRPPTFENDSQMLYFKIESLTQKESKQLKSRKIFLLLKASFWCSVCERK